MITRFDLFACVVAIVICGGIYSIKVLEKTIEKMYEQFSIQEYNHQLLLDAVTSVCVLAPVSDSLKLEAEK